MISYFMMHQRYMNVLGIGIILLLGYIFSSHRKKISFSFVAKALSMQFALALFILKTTLGSWMFGGLAHGIAALYEFGMHGVRFVFGSLADTAGPWGVIFAIRILPVVIFFGALTSLLFHLGIVQRVIILLAKLVRPILGTSGVETLCAVGNSYLGQTEAPLLVRAYLKKATDSELFVIMVSGFATLSGAILAVYAAMGIPALHLLNASIIAIPASLLMAKLFEPETVSKKELQKVTSEVEVTTHNIPDALVAGASDGLRLSLNIGAMLIAFLAVLALLDAILGWGGNILGFSAETMTLQNIFGYLFAPFAYLLGFTGQEATNAGMLLGLKLAGNEFIAFSKMLSLNFSPRAIELLTYAIGSFANFSCIGIQIGGIGVLAPTRQKTLSRLGMRALFAATFANLLSACVVGLLI